MCPDLYTYLPIFTINNNNSWSYKLWSPVILQYSIGTLMMMGMMALMIVTVAGTIDVDIVVAAWVSQATDCRWAASHAARLSDRAVRMTMAVHAAI